MIAALSVLYRRLRHLLSVLTNKHRTSTSVAEQEAAVAERYVQEFDGPLHISIAFLGAKGSGRQALATRLHGNHFLEPEDAFDPTADPNEARMYRIIGGKEVSYEGFLRSPYYGALDCPQGYLSAYVELRHVEACIFVYDVGSRAGFDDVKCYYENFVLERSLDARQHCQMGCWSVCRRRPQPYKGLVWVVANKIDRPEQEWAIAREEGEDFATSIGAIFIAMSAKTGEGHDENQLLSMTIRILLRRVRTLAEDGVDGLDIPPMELTGTRRRNARVWY